VASRLDVDPAEPCGESSGGGRHNGQPAVPVDQADDLAQHGGKVAVPEPVGVVDAHHEVVVFPPESHKALRVARLDDDRPRRPRHPDDVRLRAHGDDTSTLGAQGLRDHP